MTFWTFSSLHFISYLLRFLSLSDNKVFGTRGSNSVRKKDFGPTVSLFKAQSLTDISYQKWKRHVATYWKYEEKKLAEEKRKIIIIIIIKDQLFCEHLKVFPSTNCRRSKRICLGNGFLHVWKKGLTCCLTTRRYLMTCFDVFLFFFLVFFRDFR